MNLNWNPSLGVTKENSEPITTIGDFLDFAGVLNQPAPVFASTESDFVEA